MMRKMEQVLSQEAVRQRRPGLKLVSRKLLRELLPLYMPSVKRARRALKVILHTKEKSDQPLTIRGPKSLADLSRRIEKAEGGTKNATRVQLYKLGCALYQWTHDNWKDIDALKGSYPLDLFLLGLLTDGLAARKAKAKEESAG